MTDRFGGSPKKEGAGVFRPGPRRPTNPFPEVPNALDLWMRFNPQKKKCRILILRENSNRVEKNSLSGPAAEPFFALSP